MKAIIFDLLDTLVFIEKETNPYLKAYRQHFSKVMQYDYNGNLIREVELPGIGSAGGF